MKSQNRVRSASALALVGLFVAAGCGDESGGDGYEPTRPSAAGNAGGAAGDDSMETPSGGMPIGVGGEGGVSTPTSGKGGMAGKGGSGGTAGKGGGGTAGIMMEGGMGGAGGDTTPKSVCGNNVIEPGEDCDDGNTKGFDGCPADCRAACETCEKTFCTAVRSHDAGEFNWTNQYKKSPTDLLTTCSTLTGMAVAGKAQGVARSDLCKALVDCAKREQCAQLVPDNPPPPASSAAATYDFMHCFCSQDVTVSTYLTDCGDHGNYDPKKKPNFVGKCMEEFIEAAEADSEAAAFGGLYSGGKALGVGNSLLQLCDRTLCTEECLPQASVGVVAQIAADILAVKNDAGESAIGDLIADAERAATGTDFAFVNDGSYTSDYGAPGLIFHGAPGRGADADGRVLESEVRQLLFGMNTANANIAGGTLLVTMQLTGQQIYDFLTSRVETGQPVPFLFVQVSGMTFTWDSTTHVVTEVRKGDTPIDQIATYSITVNDYLATYVAGAANVVTTDKNPEQELVKYMKAQTQPIAPPTLNRISVAQ